MSEALSSHSWPLQTAEALAEPNELEINPTVEDYVTRPIEEGFDWPDILNRSALQHDLAYGQELYLVAFPSQLRPDADTDLLKYHDNLAHQEAASSPGFICYFKGQPDAEGNCLSFCLWQSVQGAKDAAKGPAHTAAARLARQMYQKVSLGRYIIRQDESPKGFTMIPLADLARAS